MIPRKLRRHIKRLDAVSETFLELVQESVDEQGYSRDLMEFIPLWSFEGKRLSHHYFFGFSAVCRLFNCSI